MNKYEAEHKKQYSHKDGTLITAKHKIASAVNDSWIYSYHWKNDTWLEQAQEDLTQRIANVTTDLNRLNQAQSLLNSIEKD